PQTLSSIHPRPFPLLGPMVVIVRDEGLFLPAPGANAFHDGDPHLVFREHAAAFDLALMTVVPILNFRFVTHRQSIMTSGDFCRTSACSATSSSASRTSR